MAMLPDIVAEPSAPPSAPTTANNPNGIERPKPKLLLVEDNEINLRVSRRASPICVSSDIPPQRELTTAPYYSFLVHLQEEATLITARQ